MRRVALLLFVACSGSKQSAAPSPADHQLHRTEVPDGLKVVGKAVPLATLVTSDQVGGLPVSGDVDLAIDVRGITDLRNATGSIALACPAGCRLGDDHAKLVVGGRAGALVPDGIRFGHLEVTSARIAIAIRAGKAMIEHWQLASPDLTLAVSGSVQLEETLDRSKLDVCVRFAPTPALESRDRAMAALIETTGATRGSDGQFNIRVEGSFDKPRFRAVVCDGSAPPPPPAPIAVAVGPKGDNTVAPATAASIADAITKTSETTFDVDVAKLEPLFADPVAIGKGGRAVPAVRNGKPSGWKLYAIQPDSLYARLGFVNGDTLVSINSTSINSAADALEVYTSVRRLARGARVEAAIERRGTPMRFVYTLR